MRRAKLTGAQVLRTARLLHMRYTVSELADEIGVKAETIYKSLIPAGCPNERDQAGHIWIVGTDFAAWARAYHTTGRAGQGTTERSKLPDGHARCFRCQAVKPMKVLETKPVSPYVEIVKGTCAECGAKVNRFQKLRGPGGASEMRPGEAWCRACRRLVFADRDKCQLCGGPTITKLDKRWEGRRARRVEA